MTNPADEFICDLIKELCYKAEHCFEVELRQSYILQIAQLRASMNPVIHQYQTQ